MNLKIPQATAKGFIEVEPYGAFDWTYPQSLTRRGRVQGVGDASAPPYFVQMRYMFMKDDDTSSYSRLPASSCGLRGCHSGGTPRASGQPISAFQKSSKCLIAGKVWKSQQNGFVYDPCGVAPCLCVGHHSGVEPKIIEYEKNQEIP